jgi:hypothetical protein
MRSVVLAAAIVCIACAQGTTGTDRPTRLLFVGNSLTAANNLPAMVEAVARSSGTRVKTAAVAYPNYSLEDHWNKGDAACQIQRGGWTFVVLQQGPSALPESRESLVAYVRRFDAIIRAAGARTALYMVWPEREREAAFPAVSASYAAAANAVDGVLLPVGDAWRAAWRQNSGLALYGSDGFHPSPLASALAALVVYQRLFTRKAAIPVDWTFSEADREAIRSASVLVFEASGRPEDMR